MADTDLKDDPKVDDPPADPPKDDPKAADPAPKDEPKADDPPPDDAAPDWRSFLTDAEAKKVAERFTSPDEMAKAVSDLRKQISDRIKLPGKDADEKEVAKFRKALGVPETPEAYEVKLPEGVELTEADEALIEAVKPLAHENNVPAEALNGFIAKFKEFEQQVVNEHEAALERQRDEAESALKQEWGKDYDGNLNIANRAMKQLGGDDLVEFLNKAELKDGGLLGNSPHLVRLFAKLGRQMSEDGVIQPVDANEAQDLTEKLNDLTRKAHEARAKGDDAAAQKLFRERAEIAARLEGDAPIVGAGGRAV